MIHVFENTTEGLWKVWTDTDIGYRDGRCLAVAESKQAALNEAFNELWRELEVVRRLEQEESKVKP